MRPGSYASYSITIEGGRPDAEPTLNLPPEVELAASNASFHQQNLIINGVQRLTFVFGWQVTSSTEGGKSPHIVSA